MCPCHLSFQARQGTNKAGHYQFGSDLPFILRLMKLSAFELHLRGKGLKVSGRWSRDHNFAFCILHFAFISRLLEHFSHGADEALVKLRQLAVNVFDKWLKLVFFQ